MIHMGDITAISGDAVPVVDCIIGGSPCQDLSIAGKREGLSGERSGLFMEQVRIVKEMRSSDKASGRTGVDVRPRFMVWENVPGALSSNKGEDFRAVLEEICKIADETAIVPLPPKGKWGNNGVIMGEHYSIAWRIMDAQYYGVPQRRRRIALVADFGGASAPEILFEPESLSGHSAESGEEGERTSTGTENRSGAAGFLGGQGVKAQGIGYELEKSPTLRAGVTPDVVALNDQGGSMMSVTYDVSGTLRAQEHGHQPIVFNGETVTSPTNASNPKPGDPCHTLGATGAGRAICIQGNCIDRSDTAGCNGKGWKYDQCYTLNTVDRPAVYDARGNGDGDTAPTLTGDHENRVTDYTALCLAEAYSFDSLASNSMKSKNPHSGCRKVEIAKTLDTTNPDPSKNQGGIAIVQKCYGMSNERRRGPEENCGIAPTLEAKMGMGGGNVPRIVDNKEPQLYASQSHAEFKKSDTSGCLRAKQRGIGGGVDLVVESMGDKT